VEKALSGVQLPDIIEMDEIYTRVRKVDVKSRYGLLIYAVERKIVAFAVVQ